MRTRCYFRPVCARVFWRQCKNVGGAPECRLCNRWSLLELSRTITPTPKSYHHWHPLAFRRASSHQDCACKVFRRSESRWLRLPGGGVSGVRGLMGDNWFSAAPCRVRVNRTAGTWRMLKTSRVARALSRDPLPCEMKRLLFLGFALFVWSVSRGLSPGKVRA